LGDDGQGLIMTIVFINLNELWQSVSSNEMSYLNSLDLTLCVIL